MRIQIRVSGDEETIRRLKKLGNELTKLRPELQQIGRELKSYYSGQVFASQGGILGKRWARLSPIYSKGKVKRYPGRPLLVKTGKMQNSFKATTTDHSLTIENTAAYFKYHQSSKPRTKIPYRPMMGVNGDVRNIVKQIIEKGVRQRIASAG